MNLDNKYSIKDKIGASTLGLLFLSIVDAPYVFADFQSSLQSLITGTLSGIFPMIAMFQVGVAGLSWARRAPDAKERAEAAVIGTIAVVGINGVWTYLKGHIR
jgi:hypothetical protein